MDKPSLDKSPRYKRFIEERDLALEKIAAKYSQSLSVVMDHLIELTLDVVAGMHFKGVTSIYRPNAEAQKIDSLFHIAAQTSIDLIRRMRKSVYMLSYTGEAEAIGQALGKKTKADLSKSDLQGAQDRETAFGGSIEARVWLYYNRLRRRVQDALEHGIVLEENMHDLEDRVRSAFPDHKTYKRPKKNLRSLREADTPDWLKKAREEYYQDFAGPTEQVSQLTDEPAEPVDFSSGIVPEDDWEAMVQDYKSEFLPENAFARGMQDFTDEDGVRKYDWELEQELTNDFVQTVRDGQNDLANDNGITDMLWIAVSHKTLCEACQWRDGLTSTEIEDKLNSERSDDEYDVTVPPAHPNCYCRIAPVTKELLDATPDDSISKGFDEWLTS